jgi:hypothetical protein
MPRPGASLRYRFCILGHVHKDAPGRLSPPRDHGPSWAIYGQAKGETTILAMIRNIAESRRTEMAITCQISLVWRVIASCRPGSP